MKTAQGFTSAAEAAEQGKYVVGYSSGIASDEYFVAFSNHRTAVRFANENGRNDPPWSPRAARIIGEDDRE